MHGWTNVTDDVGSGCTSENVKETNSPEMNVEGQSGTSPDQHGRTQCSTQDETIGNGAGIGLLSLQIGPTQKGAQGAR